MRRPPTAAPGTLLGASLLRVSLRWALRWGAVLVVGLLSRGAALAAPGADAERAAKELDDPRWAVRRAATVALLVDGRAALSEATDDAGPAATARLEAWLHTVEDRIVSGSATAAGHARAILSIVEAEAGPQTVSASPTLLRARVRRLLPAVATAAPEDADAESDDARESRRTPRAPPARRSSPCCPRPARCSSRRSRRRPTPPRSRARSPS